MMRVITGVAKGVRLETPAGETTRPTSERAKEAIFSMIQFEVENRKVLDLFAGSGQLGIEALSRGAQKAVFVDRSAEAIRAVRNNLKKTKLEHLAAAFCEESISCLRKMKNERFDLVFLDPPYALGAIPQALKILAERKLLLPGALLLCESGDTEDVFGQFDALKTVYRIRSLKKHGIAYLTLLEAVHEETGE